MKAMSFRTHDDDVGIPMDMAAIVMNDNGWVGTNNGWPLAGQPALYPIAQASAICYAWNSFTLDQLPNPKAISEDVLQWLR